MHSFTHASAQFSWLLFMNEVTSHHLSVGGWRNAAVFVVEPRYRLGFVVTLKFIMGVAWIVSQERTRTEDPTERTTFPWITLRIVKEDILGAVGI